MMGTEKILYGNIVDVIARKIFSGKVTVSNGRIAAIEETDCVQGGQHVSKSGRHVSGKGQYVPREDLPFILPGFTDSHIHIESTLMVPQNYARMAVANGVVGAVCDPHEIANVLGTAGVDFMIGNGKNVRFNFSFAAPSCVPSTPFETAGAVLGPQEVETMLQKEEVVALAEMMNVPGVVYGDPQVAAKLQAAKDARKPIDGHAPKTTGEMLQKYISAGITTDHECATLQEAREKLALGMKVIIREGSAACDFEALYPLIAEYPGQIMFCSDDMYPDDVHSIGYINGMVKRAIAKGMPLWETLESASVTPVKHYNLKSGLLQERDSADFIIVDNLQDFNILSTYIQGVEVYNAEDGVKGEFVGKRSDGHQVLNVFNAREISPEALQLKWQPGELKVIIATEGSLLTGVDFVEAKRDENGNVSTDVAAGIAKIVAYNRYTESVPQVAYIKGFGKLQGALASTIAHDSHNIIAVGGNDEDLAKAINCLVKEKGGIAVCDGEHIESLPLPVAGLMTLLGPDEVAQKHIALKKMASRIGCPFKAPFMTLAFMALPVIPDLKLTDKGLFDGVSFSFTTLWKEWHQVPGLSAAPYLESSRQTS